MRLWSIHPKYLDAKGLVALWREGLLAQKVLAGKTKGYKKHPQLSRFKMAPDPLGAIGEYLFYVVREAERRDYKFDGGKILKRKRTSLKVTSGQITYEASHLARKLKIRDPIRLKSLPKNAPKTHPIFRRVNGPPEFWEIQS